MVVWANAYLEAMQRKLCLTDVSEKGQGLAAPYLVLMTQDDPQREGNQAQLCLGGALPPAGQVLRASARCARPIALLGLHHLHASKSNSAADDLRKFITLSEHLA
jgi:hypothetical protein